MSFFNQTLSLKRQQFVNSKNKKKEQKYILNASELIEVRIKKKKIQPIMIVMDINMFFFLLIKKLQIVYQPEQENKVLHLPYKDKI